MLFLGGVHEGVICEIGLGCFSSVGSRDVSFLSVIFLRKDVFVFRFDVHFLRGLFHMREFRGIPLSERNPQRRRDSECHA